MGKETEIRLIIFDLDGTLYDLSDVHSANYQLQVQFLMQQMHMTNQEAIDLQERNHIYPVITSESKSATECFARLGLDMDKWKQYRESHYDASKIDKTKAITEDVIRRFADICPLVLLSSNSLGNILNTLEYLEIDSQLFKTIYCSDNTPIDEPFNKKSAMQVISHQYKVKYGEMLSVGDRYQTDVVPMLELGGKGIVVKKPQYLEHVLCDIIKGNPHSNQYYSYYTNAQ